MWKTWCKIKKSVPSVLIEFFKKIDERVVKCEKNSVIKAANKNFT